MWISMNRLSQTASKTSVKTANKPVNGLNLRVAGTNMAAAAKYDSSRPRPLTAATPDTAFT
jgi:hypothetical protein